MCQDRSHAVWQHPHSFLNKTVQKSPFVLALCALLLYSESIQVLGRVRVTGWRALQSSPPTDHCLSRTHRVTHYVLEWCQVTSAAYRITGYDGPCQELGIHQHTHAGWDTCMMTPGHFLIGLDITWTEPVLVWVICVFIAM